MARYLFKLMAYKDEYEVARLHTDRGFQEKIAAMFEGDYKVHYHLAPPLIAKRNEKGELQKQKFGPAMLTGFRVLAKLKGLRGTPLDIFGRTEERRTERALIGAYRASIEQVLARSTAANHALAVEIARIPEQIKGFGHVKERNLAAARVAMGAADAPVAAAGAAPGRLSLSPRCPQARAAGLQLITGRAARHTIDGFRLAAYALPACPRATSIKSSILEPMCSFPPPLPNPPAVATCSHP